MKNSLIAVVFFVLCYNTISAQNKIDKINITYGEEITDDKGKIIKIIGEANNKVYTLVLKGKSNYFLKIFDSKALKQISNNEIVFPEVKDKDLEFEEIVLLNDKLYAIGSVYYRKEKKYTLVGIPISESGVLSDNIITLFESTVANSSDKGGFYLRNSPDNRMLLVMHTALFEKEDAMKYEIKFFDETLKTAFATEDKVSYDDNKKDYQFTISDFDVNYKDDIFLVVNEGYRDKKKKEKVEKVEVHVFKKDMNYKKEIIKIDVVDEEIINCKMLATAKNTLQLTGFYSSVRENGKANKELKGVYNMTINLATNVAENVKFNEFDYATKVKLIGERRAKKGKDVKPLYNIHSIIEKKDGGLIVISEYQLIIVGQKQGIGPLGLQPITYVTNEMIVTCLKPDGTLEWSNVVAKEQSATVTVASFNLFGVSGGSSFNVAVGLSIPLAVMGKGPEYLSAIPIYRNGILNILFNDNVKNKGITDIEKIKSLGNYNNAVPTLFVFDDKGNITRKDPEEVVKEELVIRPGVFNRKSDNEYIIYASRKSKDKLGRMILQD
ncbi:hypothetical protein OX283_008485 [Flavobacterium sp. SUN052]|uniref:hypothetical protein n=1 Tax=Flavobacterium sp. SUN052 TaxID=3002441 RepID=UPI00237E874A|nr:hypothetical protein [Flavobacterium sp. SUN052]MEC4004691.1 hypothetical protein [Flavobacterium sp. SUN052]